MNVSTPPRTTALNAKSPCSFPLPRNQVVAPENGNRESHTNSRRRNACHTPKLLTPCIHACGIIRLRNEQTRLQKIKRTQHYQILAEPRLLQWLALTILKFHTASKLPSRGKRKRMLRAWIPRLRHQNSCCKNLEIQYSFVLKSRLAKISFDAIPVFSPTGQ